MMDAMMHFMASPSLGNRGTQMTKNNYPRPQLMRDNWLNLNGEWNFAFDDDSLGLTDRWFKNPNFTQKIQVPFAFQSKMSGIMDHSAHDIVWYHKEVIIPQEFNEQILLHFGAVDYETMLYANGEFVGKHTGGSVSFTFDITPYIKSNKVDLVIRVYDPTFDETLPRGKQAWTKDHHGIWYPRTTGIWQTVWIESVSNHALNHLKMVPNIDQGTLDLTASFRSITDKVLEVMVYEDDVMILHDTYRVKDTLKRTLTIWNHEIFKTNLHHHGKTWSPDNPFLYTITFKLLHENRCVDEVKSYFGMRKIHTENGRVYLNNRPYYLKLVLDQGYYKNSLLTAVDDEAMQNDIRLAKQMGFNGCRKHQKIEEERFLFHCDKMGYLVWEELPSTAIYDDSMHATIIDEWTRIIQRDQNHPSIMAWVTLNESWGVPNIGRNQQQQNYAMALYLLTKSIDPTRLVIANDGWEQVNTDICAIHNYSHGKKSETSKHAVFEKSIQTKEALLTNTPAGREIYANGYNYQGEPICLTEFGGISYQTEEVNGWGYSSVDSEEAFHSELKRVFKAVSDSKALAGFCYTQLADVEQETNGLLTYSRQPKIDPQRVKEILDHIETSRFIE